MPRRYQLYGYRVNGTLTITDENGNVIATIPAGGDAVPADLTVTGNVTMSGLPTADPTVAGRLWADDGVVTVSAG